MDATHMSLLHLERCAVHVASDARVVVVKKPAESEGDKWISMDQPARTRLDCVVLIVACENCSARERLSSERCLHAWLLRGNHRTQR